MTPDYLKGGDPTWNGAADIPYAWTNSWSGFDPDPTKLQQQISDEPYRFEHLDRLQCIQAYSQVFLGDRSNLLIVVNDSNVISNSTVIDIHVWNFDWFNSYSYQPYDW